MTAMGHFGACSDDVEVTYVTWHLMEITWHLPFDVDALYDHPLTTIAEI
jgi:hypothetical protein